MHVSYGRHQYRYEVNNHIYMKKIQIHRCLNMLRWMAGFVGPRATILTPVANPTKLPLFGTQTLASADEALQSQRRLPLRDSFKKEGGQRFGMVALLAHVQLAMFDWLVMEAVGYLYNS